jgi:hypothetical protein
MIAIVVAALLSLAGVSAASPMAGGSAARDEARAEISQQIFRRDGLPMLVANPVPRGDLGRVVRWLSCTPDGGCTEVASGDDVRVLEPGDVASGTTFTAEVLAGSGERSSATSDPWNGRVTALTAPRVAGTLRVGALVRPVPARWTGGWPGDRHDLRMEACRDAAGMRCETIAAQHEDLPGCRRAAAVIRRRHAGWWIRAVDQRRPHDTATAGVGYERVRDVPLLKPSRTVVRSALRGPVAATPHRPRARCRKR